MAKSKSRGKSIGSEARLADIAFQKQQAQADLDKSKKSDKDYADKEKKLNNLINLEKKLIANQETQLRLQEQSLNNVEELESSTRSLGVSMGKNNKVFKGFQLTTSSISGTLQTVSLKMKNLGPDAKEFKKEIFKTADATKSLGKAIIENTNKLKKGRITQEQYNASIIEYYENLEDQIETLEGSLTGLTGKSKKNAEAILATFKAEKTTLEASATAAKNTTAAMKGLDFATSQFAATGVPAMSEFGEVLKTAANGGKGLTLAMAGLGAAAGKALYDLGLVGDKIGTIAKYDAQIAPLQAKIEGSLMKFDLGQGKKGDKNFVAMEASMDAAASLTQMAIEFKSASKTALFGKGLGSVGYGAGQLQMAGISAETIATSMKDATSTMGSNASAKFGADVAVLAKRTGQTSEGIASITDAFMRTGNVSAETALNMQEGLRAMADQAGINLGALMEDVAAASKDALSYQLKSPNAIAKAAAFAQSLGVKFTDIAEAGKNMVLNYKDSIKAEMGLSAMLGRRVDLSQVRAKFAAGDQKGALAALKAQGLDPSKMTMFQQEQLKNATGGMDLNALQKIATRTGRTGELGVADTRTENEKFLKRTTDAESSKAIGLAVANALVNITKQNEIVGPQEAQRQADIVANSDGIKNDMAKLLQLQTEKGIMSSGGGAAIIGGILAGVLPSVIGKLGPKLSKGANVADDVVKTTAKTTTKTAAKTTTKVGAKTATKIAEKAGAKSIAKIGAKTLGKSLLKKIPIVGLLAGVGFGLMRAMEGDYTGAALELASGAVGTVPGIGTAASIGIDTALAAKDMGAFGGAPGTTPQNTKATTEVIEKAAEPTVQAIIQGTTERNQEAINEAIRSGELLNSNEYGIELQQKMLEILGLQAEYLEIIATDADDDMTINMDGKKVLSVLNSRNNKSYGLTRTSGLRTVR
jgi:hypothetical protein